MNPNHFTLLFLVALALSTGLRLWLDLRHLRHVAVHRDRVPADFVGRIELVDHRKAADYTAAKVRIGLAEIAIDVIVLLALTLGGVLGWIDQALRATLGGGYLHGLALFAAAGVLGFVIGLPASLYRTFVIEARFGFNKLTWPLWLADLAKGAALTVLIGGPLLFAVLWLMGVMGESWWLWVWGVWMAFNLLILAVYPTLIAPLFNKFTPLEDRSLRSASNPAGPLRLQIQRPVRHGRLAPLQPRQRLFHRLGQEQAHRLLRHPAVPAQSPTEIEAVLAHELGHFKHRHIVKRIALSAG
jgi:STE24 endopeptidase